jgi:UDP-N-acetylmuramoyl-tripeptide--D-alanyl-D-alanine ligase
VRADDVTLDEAGRPSFMLRAPDGAAPVALRLHGEHHVGNALAAAAVGIEVGLDVSAVAAALSAATPVSRWRMEVTETDDGLTVINDAYNANPASMAAGLRALVQMGRGHRTWAVLGPMAELGALADEAHRETGALVASLGVDRLLAVGTGAALIVQGAVTADLDPARTSLVADVDAAVTLLRAELEPGDVVLVKASRSAGLERVAAGLVEGPVRA